jgi:hypothetical protein
LRQECFTVAREGIFSIVLLKACGPLVALGEGDIGLGSGPRAGEEVIAALAEDLAAAERLVDASVSRPHPASAMRAGLTRIAVVNASLPDIPAALHA